MGQSIFFPMAYGKSLFYLSLLLLIVACNTKTEQESELERKWVSLFNGKNLEGWDIKIRGYNLNDNFGETFKVEDGLMKVSYEGYDAFDYRYGHIFYEKPFSNYRLRVEYRFIGEQANEGEGWAFRNSGIMFHSQSATSMGLEQDFPISIEAQFLGGDGENQRSTLNLCTPGTHVNMSDTLFVPHCISSSSETFHGDQWVTAELEVYNDSLIRHYVNGKIVMEYTKPIIGGGVVSGFDPEIKADGTPLKEGYIALQSESHPIHFRKVEIMDLSDN